MKAFTVILAFKSVDQNPRYDHSNKAFFAGLLEAKGITLLQYFPEQKIGIFLIFRILVDLLRVERPWL